MSKFPSLPWTDAAAQWLEGTPNVLLMLALLVIAGLCIYAAFAASPSVKALVIAWILLP